MSAKSIHIVVSSSIAIVLLQARLASPKEPVVEYTDQIAPILTRYCAGCHNDEESSGDFSMSDFAALIKGGESGPALTPGSSASSRMIQMVLGQVEPIMPPEDEPRPTDEEIALVSAWIDAGAPLPGGQGSVATKSSTRLAIRSAKIPSPEHAPQPITAIAYAPRGDQIAIARFKSIELRSADGVRRFGQFTDHPGKVNSVSFTEDGRYLLAGTGVSGLMGEAVLWRVADQKVVRRFAGHRDILYSAIISPNRRLVATAGYDQRIQIWDFDTGEMLRELTGHNGAVYDLAFDPTSELVCSASADATIKVWRVADGRRLDTRSEPLKEQYTTAISPDGNLLVGGGADNRIRVWDLISRRDEQINPLRFARFAHEAGIELVRFSHNGEFLVSVSHDGLIKTWKTATLRQMAVLPRQSSAVAAVAIAPTDSTMAIGRMDGSLDIYQIKDHSIDPSTNEPKTRERSSGDTHVSPMPMKFAQGPEQEPNDSVATARLWTAPFEVTGRIHSSNAESDATSDSDLFRFTSRKGQTWIVTVNASREKSPLDSKVEILDDQGAPVPRVLLQAVRDSYFTFRGKDSIQTGDFRLQSWQEMSLNQLLYCNGEVVKLYHYPRGPDSGFNVYPNFGSRYTFFDTPALAHALHEPCYIVEPHPPGTVLPANGLPTFTVNYENDDDSRRQLGSDSQLTFVTPHDGQYIVRLSDVRGFQGEDYHYRLSVEVPKPRFDIRTIMGKDPTVARGTGRKIGVEIERIDGFREPVEIHVDNLPTGFTVPGPVVIEADHLRAWARLELSEKAPELTDETKKQAVVRATGTWSGQQQTHSLGELTIAEKPKLLVHLTADRSELITKDEMPVITIGTGDTTTARVRVQRNGYEGRINFGKEEAAVNLPHGVYVDHTGLNGVLIPEHETERVFFITSETWVEPQERIIFLEAAEAGAPTSNPAILRVVRGE